MAKLTGVLKFRGSIGDITACKYKHRKELVIRKKKEKMSKDYYEKSPTMAPVRRNNSEFSAARNAAILLNNAFKFLFRDFERGYLYQRLAGLFKVVMSKDLMNEHGKRTIHNGLLHPEGKDLLENFRFTPDSILSDFYRASIAFDRDTSVVDLKEITSVGLGLKNATHMEFRALLLGLNMEEMRFMTSLSDPINIPKQEGEAGAIQLNCGLIKESAHLTFVFLCCRALKEEGNVLYKLNGTKNFALQLVDYSQS